MELVELKDAGYWNQYHPNGSILVLQMVIN